MTDDELDDLYRSDPDRAQQIARKRSSAAGKIVVLISVLIIVFAFLGIYFEDMSGSFDDGWEGLSGGSDGSGNSSYTVTTEIDEDASEALVEQITMERLEGLADDDDFVASVAAAFSNQCAYYVGYSADELGVDATDFAQWAVSGRTYEISSVFCYPGYDGDEPTGIVYFDSTGYDAQGVCNAFTIDAREYLSEQDLLDFSGSDSGSGAESDGGDDGKATLGDEQKEELRRMLSNEMASAGADDDSFTSIDFTCVDGDWAIDEDDFSEEMESLFVRSITRAS